MLRLDRVVGSAAWARLAAADPAGSILGSRIRLQMAAARMNCTPTRSLPQSRARYCKASPWIVPQRKFILRERGHGPQDKLVCRLFWRPRMMLRIPRQHTVGGLNEVGSDDGNSG